MRQYFAEVILQPSANLLQCFLAGYQLFCHPLSKYPGPFTAKLSDAYAGFYAICMRLHLATDRDLEKYGKLCLRDTVCRSWY